MIQRLITILGRTCGLVSGEEGEEWSEERNGEVERSHGWVDGRMSERMGEDEWSGYEIPWVSRWEDE